ncbi:MAG: hypothetical protein PHY54_11095 [Methylococcales bacterium]|nr:hypothetical protein [Methylococcales bacterium]
MLFDPMAVWERLISLKRVELEAKRIDLEERKQLAIDRRNSLSAAYKDIPLWDLFCETNPIRELLTSFGYDQMGDSFRHPNSESGSYSAEVYIDDTGRERVHTLSTNDPLYVEGSKSGHDAFSVYTLLKHGGDRNAALKDAGDNLFFINGEPFNKVKQREYAKEQQQIAIEGVQWDQSQLLFPPALIPTGSPDQPTEPNKTPFSLIQFSLFGQTETMKKQMQEDVFVLNLIAILGQITVIYGQFNTGKTLLIIAMLIESIKAGRIKGENLFYINADDTYNGLVTKNEIAEKYGFHMIAPNLNNFVPDAMMDYMRQMIDAGSATGSIIVLDTLKKFCELMDKKAGTEFMKRAREFVQMGGTLIMLAHTNKNKDENGKSKYGGTNDVASDADCVFILDEVSTDNTRKTVMFENIKMRGYVARELGASYLLDVENYHQLLESVTFTDDKTSEQLKIERAKKAQRAKDEPTISAITETIKSDCNVRTELIKSVLANYGISKPKTIKVLDFYTGELWRVERREKNANCYHLIHQHIFNEKLK